MEVCIILSQHAYELQKALEYKIEARIEPLAVLTKLIRIIGGPMNCKRRQNVGHFASTEDAKTAEKVQS